MYCLDKLQRELAYFLDIDLRDLPKVQEILQSQGYTAVKKNDEIIELGNGKLVARATPYAPLSKPKRIAGVRY